jgi:shikimate kinase
MLARRLGWDFIDVDAEIMAATGSTVADLFSSRGEAGFRELETRLTAGLSSRDRVVLAPGGGWAAQPGALEAVPPATAVVWLRVTPEEALRRLRGSLEERPLLAGARPLDALLRLAEQRTERYRTAHHVVDVDGRTAAEITEDIGAWLEGRTS